MRRLKPLCFGRIYQAMDGTIRSTGPCRIGASHEVDGRHYCRLHVEAARRLASGVSPERPRPENYRSNKEKIPT